MRAWMEPDASRRKGSSHVSSASMATRFWSATCLGPGAGSGIEMELDGWVIWTLNDDGLMTRLEAFSPMRKCRPSRPPACRSR